jgi:hypothetical protein
VKKSIQFCILASGGVNKLLVLGRYRRFNEVKGNKTYLGIYILIRYQHNNVTSHGKSRIKKISQLERDNYDIWSIRIEERLKKLKVWYLVSMVFMPRRVIDVELVLYHC